MNLQLPRKRTLLAWHRWLGIGSAIFLISLSITGLLLNHTQRLKLDEIMVRNSLILKRYGMMGDAIINAYGIHGKNTLAQIGNQMFYNGKPLATGTCPLGIIESDPITVIATKEALILTTSNGGFVEKIKIAGLPYSELNAVGYANDGSPILVADNGTWLPDNDWVNFKSYTGDYSVSHPGKIDLSDESIEKLLTQYQGEGIPLYRVILDLHSGRLFGLFGRTLMDISAIAFLVLILTGISAWLRNARRPK